MTLSVIVLLIALLDRGVVLVDDDNGRNVIVLVQHSGQVQQCRSQLYLADLAVCQLFTSLFAVLVELIAGQQLFVPPGLLCENIPDGRKGFLPGVELHILEGQEDYRVLALIIPVLLAAGPDLLIPEVDGGILVALFKISAQHIHIQRLAESTCLEPLIRRLLRIRGNQPTIVLLKISGI